MLILANVPSYATGTFFIAIDSAVRATSAGHGRVIFHDPRLPSFFVFIS